MMKRLNSLMLTIHRILGTLLSCVILMWFISGIVMVYHGNFPRPDRAGGLSKMVSLSETPDSLLPFTSLFDTIPSGTISIDRYLDVTSFHVTSRDTSYSMLTDGQPYQPIVDSERIDAVVKLWCDAPIAKVDTLTDLCQWTPFANQKAELPILRFYFDDDEQHELFVGTATGSVLQFTTSEQRFWCWVGPIPHWIYFTLIRQDFDLWCAVIYWLAGLGILMTVSGLWVGVLRWKQARQKRKFSPYRKKWYHWHFVTGLVFGIFVITFAFSGIMSLAPVPEWLSKSSYDFSPQMELSRIAPDSCKLDYRKVIDAYPEARKIEWGSALGYPVYKVYIDEAETEIVDASDTIVKPLEISIDKVKATIAEVFAEHEVKTGTMSVTMMTEPELYYRGRGSRGANALPVIKAVLNDNDNSIIYVHPTTGQVSYVNNTSRWGYWLYTALHSLRIPGLIENEVLRQILIWILMLGGAAVSLTGVVLGIRYIRRLFNKTNK